jgi:hypothetical protein
MCYSEELSLLSLSVGLIASLALIYFGNKESANTNKMIGYFYLFVTLMQLVEYFLWLDQGCNNGLNYIGSMIGPILNHLQPVLMLVLANMYLESANVISMRALIPLNVIYLIYAYYKYGSYISDSSNLCVETNECDHLNWTWKKDFNYLFYFIISFINAINFYENKNFMVVFAASYLLLLLSIFNFNKNVGEFWCLMVTAVPLISLFMQKTMLINN